MARRLPFALAFLLALAGCQNAAPDDAAAPAQRPNILWITVEDMSPHLGSWGDPHADTPRLDALAEESVRYTNAYVVAGVCAPSRSGIITGMYPTSIGTHHMRSTGRLPAEVRGYPAYLRDAGYYTTNNVKTDYNFEHDPSMWDESSNRAHWRNRPDPDQPFFAIFNFTTTHESRIARDDRYQAAIEDLPPDRLHDPGSLTTLPPYYPDTPVTRADWARYYDVVAAMDRQVGQVLDELEADGLADETIVFFYSDHGVGLPRAKRWLYDSGLRIPLLVRIPPQFRVEGQGEPGTVDDELISTIDLAPTVLRLAGADVPGHMQGRAFLGAGLAPPRAYVYGARDRMDERYDIIRAVRDGRYKYIRNYEPFKPYYQYMNTPEKGATMQELRRLDAAGGLPPAAALFMAETKPVEELYDTEADPHEIRNLAGSAEHREVLERMREAHRAWVRETRDVGLLPETLIRSLEAEHDAPIYTLVREASFPMERIREVAALAAGDRPDARPALVEALREEHPAVRYWAATGLAAPGEEARAAVPALRPMLGDGTPVVRLAAARALAETDEAAEALPVLIDGLAHESEWVRLYAAIALDELGETARPAADALRAALDDDNRYVVRVVNHALNALFGTDNIVP